MTPTSTADASDDERASRFAAAFIEGWRMPDVESFLAHFEPWISPDVRLVQPILPEARGIDAFRAEFRRLRSLVPDLRGEVHRWSGRGDVLFIELTLEGTLHGRSVRWDLVDRITLDERGRCAERVSYFDPTPILRAFTTTPGAWGKLASTGMLRGALRSLVAR